jgi:hypothetical protein
MKKEGRLRYKEAAFVFTGGLLRGLIPFLAKCFDNGDIILKRGKPTFKGVHPSFHPSFKPQKVFPITFGHNHRCNDIRYGRHYGGGNSHHLAEIHTQPPSREFLLQSNRKASKSKLV